jgi:RecB family exonuclease
MLPESSQALAALLEDLASGRAGRRLVVRPGRLALGDFFKSIIEERGYIFGLRLTTVGGLLDSLASTAGQLPPPISSLHALEAIASAGARMSHSSLSPLLELQSAQEAALSTIRELKTAGITPERLGSLNSEKLKAIARLWSLYDEFCGAHNYIDPSDRALRIVEALEYGKGELPGVETILIAAFPYVTPLQERIFKALSPRFRLDILLPGDGGRTGLFEANERFLRRAAEWPNIGFAEAMNCCQGEGRLGVLQRSLFDPLARPVEHDRARISVASAPKRYDEVEAAGSRILELIGKGVPPSRIGLTVRNLAPYDQFIRDVFGRLRIPFYYRRGLPILQSGLVRAAMRLTEAAQPPRPLRFDKLLGLVTSGYLRLDRKEEIRKGIVTSGVFSEYPEKWWERLGDGKAVSGRAESEPIETAADLKKLLDDCRLLWRDADSLGRLRELALDSVVVPEDGEDAISERDRFGFERFLRIVDNLRVEINRLRAMGLTPQVHPIERLRQELAGETIRPAVFAQEAVQVFNFFDMGYVPVDHLLVLGLDEGTAPAAAQSRNTLLSERDIVQIRVAGLDREGSLRDPQWLRNLEAQAFLLAVGSAGRELSISRPLINEDGKETTPSPYLAEILRILGIEQEPIKNLSAADLGTLREAPPYPLAVRRQVCRRLLRADLPESDGLLLPVFNILLSRNEEKGFLSRFFEITGIENRRRVALFAPQQQRSGKCDRYSGRIEDPELRERIRSRFGESYAWSAESLEKLGACPFDFFLRYCLGLEEFLLPSEETSYMDEGQILHDIARDFIRATSFPIANITDALASMRAIADAHLGKRFKSGGPESSPVPIRLLWDRVTEMMDRFVLHEAEKVKDRKPWETEFEFGKKEPCEIRLKGLRLFFRGRFDRIDRATTPLEELLVIDYKRTGKRPSFKDAASGHTLQLPLYMMASGELFGRELRSIKGAIYSFRDAKMENLDPFKNDRHNDWQYFFGLSDAPSEAYKDEEVPARRLSDILEELVGLVGDCCFPVEGRNKAEVSDLANLVGRWLEVPPEFEEGGAD